MNRIQIVAVISVLFLTGCGSAAQNTDTSQQKAQNTVVDNRTESDGEMTATDNNETVVEDNREETESAEISEADFDVNGYLYENSIGDSLYFITVTNNSSSNVGVTASGTACDSAGSVIGAAESEIDILGAGETSIMYMYFDSVSGIDHVDYELEYNPSSYYQPVVGAISLEQTINDSNLTLIATNTGTVNAQFVEAYALFFDAEGNIVSYASTYITDDDSELKPGATLSVQLDAYNDFDHVECYLTGRSDGSASEASSSAISDSDFDIKEYIYEDSIGSTSYYLIIKNNSDETVKISGNATAYDSSENVIGAGDCSVDVLGPGEETIAYFYFDFVSGLDHIDYKLNYSESDYYEPVINELSMEQNINDKNVVVTVTNNGTEAAEFVEVYALFFDQDNNIVGTSSAYAIDDDSELKPGESISKQLDIYDSFDHVECYLTGRRYK